MAEIFDFRGRLASLPATGQDVASDEFLLNEGLDLLVAYRSISDVALRRRIKQLVEEVAALSLRLQGKRD